MRGVCPFTKSQSTIHPLPADGDRLPGVDIPAWVIEGTSLCHSRETGCTASTVPATPSGGRTPAYVAAPLSSLLLVLFPLMQAFVGAQSAHKPEVCEVLRNACIRESKSLHCICPGLEKHPYHWAKLSRPRPRCPPKSQRYQTRPCGQNDRRS